MATAQLKTATGADAGTAMFMQAKDGKVHLHLDLKGLTPGEHGVHIETMQSMFAIYGYGLTVTNLFGTKTEAVVKAFQRHFRPALVDGIADVSTIETLRKLIKARPKG